MKRVFLCLAVLMISAMVFSSVCLAESKLDKKVNACATVLDEIMMMPEKGIPSDLLKSCKAIAIFPSTVSGGFIIGAKGGTGVVVSKMDDGQWSAPAFLGIGGGSFGLQVGAQATDIVLVIMNQKGLDNLMMDKVKLGGEVGIAAGPVGRNAEIATDVMIGSIIYSYSRAKGLFAGVALAGAMVTQNNTANADYYGQKVKAKDILSGKVTAPESAKNLIATIEKYTK